MKTNVTYQDNWDPEDCEVTLFGADVKAVPSVGEVIVLFEPGAEVGKPYRVLDRLWDFHREHTDADWQHVTILIEKHEKFAK
jgi:hypothetical protein